jgi:hypothetical protein
MCLRCTTQLVRSHRTLTPPCIRGRRVVPGRRFGCASRAETTRAAATTSAPSEASATAGQRTDRSERRESSVCGTRNDSRSRRRCARFAVPSGSPATCGRMRPPVRASSTKKPSRGAVLALTPLQADELRRRDTTVCQVAIDGETTAAARRRPRRETGAKCPGASGLSESRESDSPPATRTACRNHAIAIARESRPLLGAPARGPAPMHDWRWREG